ncbi:alkyl hydroperoxide reductase subunit F [Prevotella histicola]|uniref:alkyl hydroperoxide reductase subunit F n=1 Tax=Prevotella histicola TaxID=470565 RepID=UPI001C5F7F6C|nr:alkyl hydroperoxide reductase subunit F [Prevotella histicola]MBW4777300.1 alkyl hydroperoxide reductase subunit F [Prevotella histicola]
MLDSNILNQVREVFSSLTSDITLSVIRNSSDAQSKEFTAFIDDIASTSDKVNATYTEGDHFSFSILHDGKQTGISFRGIPNGHEFTSLLLAVLNADGKGKNLPDSAITARIKALKGKEIRLQTYVSLTCTNCPDVVQALNVMALANPNITHEMIDGGLWQDEVTRLNIQGVPSVFLNGEPFHTGRGDLGTLLGKLEDKLGTDHDAEAGGVEHNYDVVVLGGGPAGASAAIYSARKGLRVAVVAERIGGQVNDTTEIANVTSVPKTTGTKLAADLRTHLNDYPIDIFDNRKVMAVNLQEAVKRVSVRGGETFLAPAVIVATGANWRRLGLPDEEKYIGHGEHFCPHCDGPFYKDKDIAVIGGGNSGIEAAIDLAGICRHVTVLEFADSLRADDVLQQKMASLPNVELFTSTQTTALLGDGTRLTGIRVKDRKTEEEHDITLDGIFVQIGLMPNSDVVSGQVELSPRKEIIIDATNRTNVSGVYAAGDVTTVPYKQITIAMGEGAKAALSAFDDRVRGVIQ